MFDDILIDDICKLIYLEWYRLLSTEIKTISMFYVNAGCFHPKGENLIYIKAYKNELIKRCLYCTHLIITDESVRANTFVRYHLGRVYLDHTKHIDKIAYKKHIYHKTCYDELFGIHIADI
jgi:hypothetical protein